MSRRVAITGAAGQLGRQLVRAFAETGDEVLSVARPEWDIESEDALRRLADWAPDVVVNSAAWTDVDGCARDPERAMEINGVAAGSVAGVAARAGARDTLESEVALVQGELAQSGVAQEKQRLTTLSAQLAQQFRKDWGRVQHAAERMDEVLVHVAQLQALDLSPLPTLQSTVQQLAPEAFRANRLWMPAREALCASAALEDDLAAFELEPLDQALRTLEARLLGQGDASVMSVLVAARSELMLQQGALADEQTALRAEQALLLRGRTPAPGDVQQALSLLETELPASRPHLLASLVEPRAGSGWQAAIEGYMGRDRFALIVEPEFEEDAIRLLRQHFARRSPKVVQGTKALEDTRSFAPAPNTLLSELVCEHPVAKAYLFALYGRVRQVASEAELRRTPQGLMQKGWAAAPTACSPAWPPNRSWPSARRAAPAGSPG
jgi:NAD(P)-dependent dehydrogenase (short-subunit alcohol dehydrogenase family)